MKRSEMVQKIINLVYLYSEDDFTLSYQEADLILQDLEKAGMLPPGLNHNGDGESFDYEWELED